MQHRLRRPSPVFRQHPMILGGHLQTVTALFWPTKVPEYKANLILIPLPDGDQVALHDDCPPQWKPGDRVVLILHGLAGCHGSGYMARAADKLNMAGIRTFRMDMRGTGASMGLAKLPGHAGRTEDAEAAVNTISKLCPDSELTMVGFSMGGNITLGTLANASKSPIGNLTGGIAISPPVDLARCCIGLTKGLAKLYNRYLIGHLVERWQATGGEVHGAPPRSIYEFDDRITAPLSGFRDAEDYYTQCSAGPRLHEITLPTLILAAKDDPMIAFDSIESKPRSSHVTLLAPNHGGHLGFMSRATADVPDGRWMDWFVVEACLGLQDAPDIVKMAG